MQAFRIAAYFYNSTMICFTADGQMYSISIFHFILNISYCSLIVLQCYRRHEFAYLTEKTSVNYGKVMKF